MNPAITKALELLSHAVGLGDADDERIAGAIAALRAIPMATKEELAKEFGAIYGPKIVTCDWWSGFRACELHHFGDK